jgi:hypothetical protein
LIAAGRRVRVMPQLKVDQGITAARTIFGKSFFDAEKCADGIQALRHYRYEADEAHLEPSGKPRLRKEPLHDWASHAADAFRTAAVMIREPERKPERRGAGFHDFLLHFGCSYFLMWSTLQTCSMDTTSIRLRWSARSRSTASSELSAITCFCLVDVRT